MHNTGLSPLSDKIIAFDYFQTDYPSLARLLKKKISCELIGETRDIWNHANTSRCYGFDRLYDYLRSEFDAQHADSAIFKTAVAHLKSFPQPFYALVSTITMHDPYEITDNGLPYVKYLPKDLESKDRGYLAALYAFDKALSQLINDLKIHGLYENSVIVLTGDHEARHSAVSPFLRDNFVPLFIINSGLNSEPYMSKTIFSQYDVFPTVLDVMGKDSYPTPQFPNGYRGVGCSVLRRPYAPASPEKLHASEVLIKSCFGTVTSD
ncbi:MAG: sulfatase-like hydrolase/transferase [Muribaculum sp.]|nr:sulfatase-like hydrolase/transferase [Muribaculum sp.]